MTVGWGVIFLLISLLLYEQWKAFDRKHRCWYCNELLGHTDHCPYNNKDVA